MADEIRYNHGLTMIETKLNIKDKDRFCRNLYATLKYCDEDDCKYGWPKYSFELCFTDDDDFDIDYSFSDITENNFQGYLDSVCHWIDLTENVVFKDFDSVVNSLPAGMIRIF